MSDPRLNPLIAEFYGYQVPPLPNSVGRFARPEIGISGAVQAVGQRFPRLLPHLAQSVVGYGTPRGPDDNRQLEFYPPWERDNPNPNRNTIEIYNRNLRGPALQAAIAGDLLHALGSIDPRNGRAIDSNFLDMQRRLGGVRNADALRVDRAAYERDRAAPYGAGVGGYDQWDQRSRIPAYVRAGLFPENNPEWANAITPEMRPVLNEMRTYLQGR